LINSVGSSLQASDSDTLTSSVQRLRVGVGKIAWPHRCAYWHFVYALHACANLPAHRAWWIKEIRSDI